MCRNLCFWKWNLMSNFSSFLTIVWFLITFGFLFFYGLFRIVLREPKIVVSVFMSIRKGFSFFTLKRLRMTHFSFMWHAFHIPLPFLIWITILKFHIFPQFFEFNFCCFLQSFEFQVQYPLMYFMWFLAFFVFPIFRDFTVIVEPR